MEINWVYLIVSAMGVYVLVTALISRSRAGASQTWSGVQGTIVEAVVRKHERIEVGEASSTTYSAHIRYSYTINSQEYFGERVHFGAEKTAKADAEETVRHYSQGASVMVYYDPDKPQDAVLEKRSGSGWLQIGLGIILLIAGVYLAIK
jgi:hypothetical protein